MSRPIMRTDVHSLLTILTRAVALCLFVYALIQLTQLLPSILEGGFDSLDLHWGYLITGPAVLMVASFILWLYADLLMRLSLSRRDPPVFESDLAPSEWQGIVFSGIGLWLVVDALLDFVYWLPQLILGLIRARSLDTWERLDFWTSLREDLIVDPIVIAASLAIGLLLLLRARGLVGLLARIRGYHRYVGADAGSERQSTTERPTGQD